MRIVRTIVTALVLALVGLGGLGVSPAGAERALPKRVVTQKDPVQVSYNAYRLKGTVEEPQAAHLRAPGGALEGAGQGQGVQRLRHQPGQGRVHRLPVNRG
jgi:hypothetical protein